MIQQSTHNKKIGKQGFMLTTTYKCLYSFTNVNFMTPKQPKDQDKDFEKRVSGRLETKTQVS